MQLESRMNAIYQILWTAGLPFFLVFAHMVINKTLFPTKESKKKYQIQTFSKSHSSAFGI